MTTEREREELIEAVAGAWRPRGATGSIQDHPAWHDLDDAGRVEAYRAALVERQLEAALDGMRHSATVRAVLRRVSGA